MFKIILWTFLLYGLYRFIVGIVIPVAKTTKAVKKQMQAMQQQAQQHAQAQGFQQQTATKPPPMANPAKPAKGDYIEFEEVK